MRYMASRRRRLSAQAILLTCALFTGFGLLMLAFKSLDPSTAISFEANGVEDESELDQVPVMESRYPTDNGSSSCATVEKMGEVFAQGFAEASLRVRGTIRNHFALHGASRIRGLPPEQFCRQGFVLGKASEAGFGNEMYKILTAAALSIMLNRSLIIGQTRHIGSLSSLSVLHI